MIGARWGVAFALLLTACPVAAGAGSVTKAGEELAYFQTKNIFHSGLRGTHTVALTFDDGPNYRTGEVLDVLKRLGVKGTFFVVGRMARSNPAVLARIPTEGHLLANHTDSHSIMGDEYAWHPERLVAEIREVDQLIAPLMPPGSKFYFRAPYGAWGTANARVLNSDPVLKKYVGPIYWDEGGDVEMSDDGNVMSAADWECWHRHWGADTCAKGYLREIRRKDGGVVLLHCIFSTSASLAESVVQPLIDEGYSFVRLDQIEDYQQYETTPQPSGSVVASNGMQQRVLAR